MNKNLYQEYFELIHTITKNELKQQLENGSFLPGNNGPHGDLETPVRNTAYWLYTLCWLIDQGYENYREHALSAANYLLSKEARPMGAAFYCRKNPEKDFSNGLIGQAWVIECLTFAADILDLEDLKILAINVHQQHRWNIEKEGWHSLNVEGSHGKVNTTFNQQLWFAAVGANIDGYRLGKERAQKYLNNVEGSLNLYADGIIFHDTQAYKWGNGRFNYAQIIPKRIFLYFYNYTKKNHQRKRSVGYHAFNLVALEYLRKQFPEHSFWKSSIFSKISDVYKKESYIRELKDNKFAYSYNPVGYEYGFFVGKDIEKVSHLLDEQKKVINIINTSTEVYRSEDKTITKSRIYELCRMLNEIER